MNVGRADDGSVRLATSVEERGDEARFVVVAADPLVRGVPRAAGLPAGRRRAARHRWFPREPSLGRRHAHFAASIEPMVAQKARLVRVPWAEALLEFRCRVEAIDLGWWLYGSAALAVRGLAVEPGDIDVHVDDAALAGRLLDDLLVTPVERMDGWLATYTGARSATRSSSGSRSPMPRATIRPPHTSRGRSSRRTSRRCRGAGTASASRRFAPSSAPARSAG